MQGMKELLFSLSVALAASEVVNPAMVGFFTERQTNYSMPPVEAATPASTVTREVTKPESWTPSQPDVTRMLSYPTMPNPQPFVPTNYYHPGNLLPPPPTNEVRSEHYTYPYESNYVYPVSQPPIDSSLMPTTKHFVIVSFIGLLLLFAIIQNSIAAAKRKDALVEILSNRRKRNIVTSLDFEPMTPELKSILIEDARIRCIQRTLCFENRKLLEDLGIFGEIFANYLTFNVHYSLKNISPGWDRFVENAANAGLRSKDCDIIYKDCNFETVDDSMKLEMQQKTTE